MVWETDLVTKSWLPFKRRVPHNLLRLYIKTNNVTPLPSIMTIGHICPTPTVIHRMVRVLLDFMVVTTVTLWNFYRIFYYLLLFRCRSSSFQKLILLKQSFLVLFLFFSVQWPSFKCPVYRWYRCTYPSLGGSTGRNGRVRPLQKGGTDGRVKVGSRWVLIETQVKKSCKWRGWGWSS